MVNVAKNNLFNLNCTAIPLKLSAASGKSLRNRKGHLRREYIIIAFLNTFTYNISNISFLYFHRFVLISDNHPNEQSKQGNKGRGQGPSLNHERGYAMSSKGRGKPFGKGKDHMLFGQPLHAPGILLL